MCVRSSTSAMAAVALGVATLLMLTIWTESPTAPRPAPPSTSWAPQLKSDDNDESAKFVRLFVCSTHADRQADASVPCTRHRLHCVKTAAERRLATRPSDPTHSWCSSSAKAGTTCSARWCSKKQMVRSSCVGKADWRRSTAGIASPARRRALLMRPQCRASGRPRFRRSPALGSCG